jgi:hypothetical protein
MDFTPASNVLSHPFTGRLRPRHFAGECAYEPRAVALLNSTVSKAKSKGSSFFSEKFTLNIHIAYLNQQIANHASS